MISDYENDLIHDEAHADDYEEENREFVLAELEAGKAADDKRHLFLKRMYILLIIAFSLTIAGAVIRYVG